MAVITTGTNPKALWPGIHAWWGQAYNKHPLEWTEIFDVKESSDKAYEETVEATGFGLAPVKPEGASIVYDTQLPGPVTRFTHVVYGLGFIVTEEEEDDNQYEQLARRRTESLAFSMRTTKEIVHANILNRAFSSSFLGGDGKELVATDHPTGSGVQSNELATPADFSDAALEDMIIQIGQAKNNRGHPIALRPQKLVVGVASMFEAYRVLKSDLQSNTSSNNVNAVRAMGMLPGGVVVNHYLTDPDAWFIITDAPDGLIHFRRKPLVFAKDSDFDTSNKKHKATERYSAGWSDWRAVYGSVGA